MYHAIHCQVTADGHALRLHHEPSEQSKVARTIPMGTVWPGNASKLAPRATGSMLSTWRQILFLNAKNTNTKQQRRKHKRKHKHKQQTADTLLANKFAFLRHFAGTSQLASKNSTYRQCYNCTLAPLCCWASVGPYLHVNEDDSRQLLVEGFNRMPNKASVAPVA